MHDLTKRAEGISRALKVIGHDVDKHVEQSVERARLKGAGEPTCRKGCNHCCYSIPMATVGEALACIGAAIGRGRMDLVTRFEKIADDAQTADVITKSSNKPADKERLWRQEKRACTFLDTHTGECAAYEVRPFECRTYTSLSDPSLCASGEPIKIIDAYRGLAPKFGERIERAHRKHLKLRPRRVPLPVAVLAATNMLAGAQLKGVDARREAERVAKEMQA